MKQAEFQIVKHVNSLINGQVVSLCLLKNGWQCCSSQLLVICGHIAETVQNEQAGWVTLNASVLAEKTME
ncbi:MAG: hypothetical protein CML20_02110 [Rheinheimera sp.]|nr:hypothetical protein [Rheinheimera sp.]